MFVRNFIQDGDEMGLGKGVDGASVALPDPQICNLRLAVARVFSASGFAEVVENFHKDNDNCDTTNFSDELSRRLARLFFVQN